MINEILMRIASAPKDSPISVFATGRKLKAVFGSTVKTQSMIHSPRRGDPEYIGTFHEGMDLQRVKKILETL